MASPDLPESKIDPKERGALIFGTAVLAVLLLWSVDGLQQRTFSPPQRLAWIAVAMGSGLAWLALLASLRAPDPLARLGLVPTSWRAVAGGCVGVVALSHGIDSVLTWFAPEGSAGVRATREALAFLPAGELPLVLAAMAGVVPLGEELFFRGLLQRGIARAGYPVSGLLLASALFGAAHGDWLYATAAGVLGLALGLLLHIGGSLLPALAAHIANNLIAILETTGAIALPEALTGPPGAILGLCGGAAALTWGLWAAAKRDSPGEINRLS